MRENLVVDGLPRHGGDLTVEFVLGDEFEHFSGVLVYSSSVIGQKNQGGVELSIPEHFTAVLAGGGTAHAVLIQDGDELSL